MKHFFILLLKLIGVLLICAVVLDVFYTLVYQQASGRNKIDYIFSAKPKEFDVVFLGSSRANNHFIPSVFQKHGLETFNFGMSGSHLFESALVLKLLIAKKHKIKYIIMDADLNLASNEMAPGIASRFLPYIHTSEVVNGHFKSQKDYYKWCYIPFYRYVAFESRIGFRDMFFNLIHKKTSDLENNGYFPLYTNEELKKNDLSDRKIKDNVYYNQIKKICLDNHINLIAVTTPMCSNTSNMEYFDQVQQFYPEIHNYENLIQDDKYFSSCGHLNHQGALQLSEALYNDFFKNRKP